MAKKVNWYLEGWTREKQLTGRNHSKTVWHYHGPYYTYNLDGRKLLLYKLAFVLLTVIALGTWLGFCFVQCKGRDTAWYTGAPWYLVIIPFMYMIMGAFGVIYIKPKMTYRDMYASYKRLKISTRIIPVLMVISLIGEVVYIIAYRAELQTVNELIWLVGHIVITACCILVMLLQSKYSPQQITG